MVTRSVKLGTGIADQALSSMLGLVVAVAVARSVSASAFGAFALAQAAYYLFLGTTRSVTSEPFTVRFSGASRELFAREARRAAGAAILVSLAASTASLVGAAFTSGQLGNALVALAVALPALLLHDFLRFAAYSQHRGRIALESDLVWVGGVVLAMSAAVAADTSSTGAFLLAWGLPALGGALWSSFRLGVVPDPRGGVSWWRSQRELAPRYLGEFAASSGVGQLSLYLVGAIAGLAAAGALRAGQVVLGPLNILFMGVQAVAVPEGVSLARRSTHSLVRFSTGLSATLTAAALGWGMIVVFLPTSLGEALLGDSWQDASAVAPILALSMAGTGLISGAFVGLRALAAARRSLRVRTAVAPVILAATTLGAYVGDARGAALGLAVAMWFGAILWWLAYHLELRVTTAAVPGRDSDATLAAASDG